jgi:hypothetical protein
MRPAPDPVAASTAGLLGRGAANRADALLALLVAVVAAAIAAAALTPVYSGNDQALFVYYAERIRAGAVLYADLWDNKQPGIFGFYALGGALFGEGWPAVRLLYAIWLGAAAGTIAWIARIVAPGTAAWIVAPVLTVGLTLLRTTVDRPAQVEALAGLPLAALLLAILVEPAGRGGRAARWIAAGALTGVVAALKLVLAPVAAALIACGLAWRIAVRATGPAGAIGAGALTLVGFAVVWLPILGWIRASGAWDEFVWTMLDYPRLALAQVEVQKPAFIVGALRWLAVTVALMVPVAAFQAWRGLRAPRTRDGLVAIACVAWVAVGFAMFLTQRFSWWDTHMDLIVWPFGLLAALGCVRLLEARPAAAAYGARAPRPWWAIVLVAAVAANVALHGARTLRSASSNPEWPGPAAEREALEVARAVAADAKTPCGTVYAIGDQAGVERRTGLRQAIATHGLWFGAFLPAQAARLPDELRDGRPDLLYFDGAERLDFRRKFPDASARIEQWIASDYVPLRADPLGQWYQRRIGPDDAATCPAPRRFTIPAAAGR